MDESGVPTMFSRERLSRTSLMPHTPVPIEPIPTAMRTQLAAIPPYSNNLRFMATPFTGDSMPGVSAQARAPPSGPSHAPVAGFPRASGECSLDRGRDHELFARRHDLDDEVPEEAQP